MKLTLLAGALALGILAVGSSVNLKAQEQTRPTTPDTTRPAQRDRSAQPTTPDTTKPTADQAKNATSDRETMQKIRKALMDDKSLSSSAHNVKVISQDGKVTLKGNVSSEEEKKSIEEKATEVAGSGNVTNDLTVKPSKKGSE